MYRYLYPLYRYLLVVYTTIPLNIKMREIAVSVKNERNLNMQKKKVHIYAVGKTNKQNRRSKRAKHNRIKSPEEKKIRKIQFFFRTLFHCNTDNYHYTTGSAMLTLFLCFSLFILMHGTPRWRKTGIMEKKFPFFFRLSS